ncbi:MAG TPA: RIP metalloprotease RseP [Oligoflexia bacterium]|nr:RIP metalloprotease RseP [Oligoflexia bacterium]HMR24957.1 RIP metalloprotease RseP [Oligoflexia bacterium]
MFASVVLPIVLFGGLVFFHELGHFLVAKKCGVYVERFAIGFGPAIFKKQWGETEYALCAFPLGGYVKMHGEEMEAIQGDVKKELSADDPRSYMNQPVWNRIAIASMGPIFNLILPVFVYAIIFWVGTDTLKPVIGDVEPGQPAAVAGLKAGDEIVSINGEAVNTWNHFVNILRTQEAGDIDLTFKRNQRQQNITVKATRSEVENVYGEKTQASQIGVSYLPFLPIVGISSEDSAAYKAGLRTGDEITKINEKDIQYWWQVEQFFDQELSQNMTLQVKRYSTEALQNNKLDQAEEKTIALNGKFLSAAHAGIENGQLYIRYVLPDSVAQEAGLQVNDKVVSLNGEELNTWSQFHQGIQSAEEALKIGILRNNIPLTLTAQPQVVSEKDELTQDKKQFKRLGVQSAALTGMPAFFKERYTNPFKALHKGVEETIKLTVLTAKGLGKLFMGKLSMNSLGGPISIFYLAGTSYKKGGFDAFFRMMAMLSITLALLNLLPIPMLDGGHLLFFFIEVIKGSPVSEKVVRIGHTLGFAFIIGLMILTFYVDLNRFLFDRIRSLFN